jgi:O-acetyl-ADP-ribose deacetylase (regulator of RNase III)
MGKYTEVEGNLLKEFLEEKFDVIGHGANCFNSMSGGIAAQIAKIFPEAQEADNITQRGDLMKLGSLSLAVRDNGQLIFNLYTQYQPGRNLDYSALILSLRKMATVVKGRNLKIGFPMIGCGIAGGNWTKVRRYIKREFRNEDVTIVIFKQ